MSFSIIPAEEPEAGQTPKCFAVFALCFLSRIGMVFKLFSGLLAYCASLN